MTYKGLVTEFYYVLGPFLWAIFFTSPLIPMKFNISILSNNHKVTNNWPYVILNPPGSTSER